MADALKPKVKSEGAPTPAPATPAPDEIDGIEEAAKKANPNWKPSEGYEKLRGIAKTRAQEADAARKEAADLREKLSKAVPTGTLSNEEAETLRTQNKVMLDRLAVLDLQSHPGFQQQYVAPKANALKVAADLLGAASKVDLAALLDKPRHELGKAIADVAKDLPPFDQAEFNMQMRTAYDLHTQSKAALAKSGETLAALQTNSRSRQEASFNQIAQQLASDMGEHLPTIEIAAEMTPEEKTDAEKYNSAVGTLRHNAQKIAFETTDEKGVAANAFKAAAYDLHIGEVMPRLLRQIESMGAANKALADELAAIRSRNPNSRISSEGGTGTATDPNDLSQMDHHAAAKAAFRR